MFEVFEETHELVDGGTLRGGSGGAEVGHVQKVKCIPMTRGWEGGINGAKNMMMMMMMMKTFVFHHMVYPPNKPSERLWVCPTQ